MSTFKGGECSDVLKGIQAMIVMESALSQYQSLFFWYYYIIEE